MPLPSIVEGDSDLVVRQKFDLVKAKAELVDNKADQTDLDDAVSTLTQANADLQDALNLVESDAVAAVLDEKNRRESGDQTNATNIAAETQRATGIEAALATDVNEVYDLNRVAHLFRPGDAPGAFTTSLDGMDPRDLPAIPADWIETSPEGKAVVLRGRCLVAPRGYYPIEALHSYLLRWGVRRKTNSADPDNDGVKCNVALYDYRKFLLPGSGGSVTGEHIVGMSTGAGYRSPQKLMSAGGNAEIINPPAAVYFKPYVENFGSDDVETYVAVLGALDVTGNRIYGPAFAEFAEDLAALTSLDLGDRVDALEARAVPMSAWVVRTANTNAVAGGRYLCDTSGGSFTVTLPLTPSEGAEIWIYDRANTFAGHNLTVGRNGQTIEGAADNMTVDVNRAKLQLVFSGGSWRL